MSNNSIISGLRYKNAPAAIDWLCNTFGFTRHLVVEGEGDRIEHCQLLLPGGNMIMLGSSGDVSEYDKLMTAPEQVNGLNTQSLYVVIENLAAHYDKVVAAGATIIDPLSTKDYGGGGYGCLDLEGHVWSFGDYDPYPPD